MSLALLAALATSACASPRGAAPHTPLHPQASAITLPAATSAYAGEHDLVAQLLQLPSLAVDSPRGAPKEVRVWIGQALGYPRRLIRVLDDGERVRGDMYYYWRVDGDSSRADSTRYEALIRRRMRGTCVTILTGHGYEACTARFVDTPDWTSALREAEAAGLWTLPDESTLPQRSFVIDGWSLDIEARDRDVYHAFGYASPRTDASPESARALRIAQAFGRIHALVAPSEAVLRYRGLVRVGPSLSEIIPCGTEIRWGFQGNIGGTGLEWSNRPAADSLEVGIQQRYVEVTGEVTPVWLARQWRSDYSRVLEVHRVEKAMAWSPEACAGAPPPRIPG